MRNQKWFQLQKSRSSRVFAVSARTHYQPQNGEGQEKQRDMKQRRTRSRQKRRSTLSYSPATHTNTFQMHECVLFATLPRVQAAETKRRSTLLVPEEHTDTTSRHGQNLDTNANTNAYDPKRQNANTETATRRAIHLVALRPASAESTRQSKHRTRVDSTRVEDDGEAHCSCPLTQLPWQFPAHCHG